jgi:hypothetical protein
MSTVRLGFSKHQLAARSAETTQSRGSGETADMEVPSLVLLAHSDEFRGGVQWVAAWRAAQPRWRVEFGEVIGHVDAPVGMVQQPVVAAAQGYTIGETGRAVVNPVNTMVNITPAGRDSTSGKGAATIT